MLAAVDLTRYASPSVLPKTGLVYYVCRYNIPFTREIRGNVFIY